MSGLAPSVSAGPINLGGAADYAVVAVGGSAGPPLVQSHLKLYQSATVVNGNVAEGPYTSLDHGIDATINGRWDYDLTDINPLVAQVPDTGSALALLSIGLACLVGAKRKFRS